MNRRGSHAIELALSMPFILWMMGGIIDWGWYFSNEYKVQEAARTCARTGASTDQDDGPEAAGEAAARAALDAEGLTGDDADVTTEIVVNATAGDLFHCVVSLDVPPMIGLYSFVLTTRNAEVTMRMEDQ